MCLIADSLMRVWHTVAVPLQGGIYRFVAAGTGLPGDGV